MSAMIIKSREANDLKLTAYHGHFATRHSHNSHYLDITRMKHECAMADIAAASLANHYVYEKEIDTVVCLDGSEVIGTFLARQLSQKNLFSLSSEKNICVVAPEHDSNGLLIFRDNLRKERPAADLHGEFGKDRGSRARVHRVLRRHHAGGRSCLQRLEAGGRHPRDQPVFPGGYPRICDQSCQGLSHVQGRAEN